MEALLPVQKVHPLVFSFWVAPSAFEVNNGIEYLLAHTEHTSACCPNISASACLNDIISTDVSGSGALTLTTLVARCVQLLALHGFTVQDSFSKIRYRRCDP